MSRQNTSFPCELEIDSEQLAKLLTYPKFEEQDYRGRLEELKLLGVNSLFLGGGGSTINGASICGKGCVGLVLSGRTSDGIVAVKVRRTDADRPSMDGEAQYHRLANGAGVGPRYIRHSRNVLVMEFVRGQSIIDWVRTAEPGEFRQVAESVLRQCFALDGIGLDHGELSRLGRHVIVNPQSKPFVIDFESASTTRRTANVTSAAQSLFLYGAVAAHAKRLVGSVDGQKAVSAIREYKRSMGSETFERVLHIILGR